MSDPGDPTATAVDLGAIPTARLAYHLRAARQRSALALDDLAARPGHSFGVDLLTRVEVADIDLTDGQVRELLDLYGVDPRDVAPERSRLVIDLEAGTVASGPHVADVPGGADPDEVLNRYLALVYEMRGLATGTPVPLRALDLDVLSRALEIPPATIEARLTILMASPSPVVAEMRRSLRRRLLVPAVGAVVAVTAAGLLILLPGSDADTAVGPTLGARIAVDASTALTQATAGAADQPAPPVPQVAPAPPEVAPAPPEVAPPALEVAPPGADDPVISDAPLVVENPAVAEAPAPQPAPQPAPPGADDPVITDDPLVVENDTVEVAPPGADDPVISEEPLVVENDAAEDPAP
ncbi:MAG TPA: hypothetical protein VK866_17940 [Acidimicrobiales bacterium]|nr:hypothetical protein [Acidimicrobiales bacterium]